MAIYLTGILGADNVSNRENKPRYRIPLGVPHGAMNVSFRYGRPRSRGKRGLCGKEKDGSSMTGWR